MNNKIVRAGNVSRKLVLALFAVVMLTLLMFPVVAMIGVSLKSNQEVFSKPVTWFPAVMHWENYVEVFKKMDVLTGFKNSLIVTAGTIVIIMLIAIPAAYALSKLNFKIKKSLYYIVLISQMFAPIIVVIPLYQIMNNWGLINTRFALILMNVTFNLAFIVLLLKSSFDNVPNETIEAATIDGCTRFQTLTRIIVPISSTGIAVAVIFAFTRTWNEFLFSFTYISSTDKKTIIVKLYEILKNNPAVGIPWELVMAGAVLTTIPLVVLFISIREYITGDATKGAIK